MSGGWTGESASYASPAASPGALWAEEAAARGGRGSQQVVGVARMAPPAEIARLLRTGPDDAVVVRRRVMYLDAAPVELTDSYLPASIADDTPLAEPLKIPGGAVALLARLGYRADRVAEEIAARPPEPAEAVGLALPDGEWVLTLTRAYHTADGTPFQADLITMPARGRRLNYELRTG